MFLVQNRPGELYLWSASRSGFGSAVFVVVLVLANGFVAGFTTISYLPCTLFTAVLCKQRKYCGQIGLHKNGNLDLWAKSGSTVLANFGLAQSVSVPVVVIYSTVTATNVSL